MWIIFNILIKIIESGHFTILPQGCQNPRHTAKVESALTAVHYQNHLCIPFLPPNFANVTDHQPLVKLPCPASCSQKDTSFLFWTFLNHSLLSTKLSNEIWCFSWTLIWLFELNFAFVSGDEVKDWAFWRVIMSQKCFEKGFISRKAMKARKTRGSNKGTSEWYTKRQTVTGD